jgi:hypothetical protein
MVRWELEMKKQESAETMMEMKAALDSLRVRRE